MFRISDAQMQGLEHVSKDAFIDAVCRFAREDLTEAVAHLDDELLRARVTRDHLASCDLGVHDTRAAFQFLCVSLLLGVEPFYERAAFRTLFASNPDDVPGFLLRLLAERGPELWPDENDADEEGEP